MIAPPPWRSQINAVVWWHRATPAGRRLVPAALSRRALPVTLGGLISYREGPVGPYGEVFGAAFTLRAARLVGHVPFMAVDSGASLAGGRHNWALPKEPAEFGGIPGRPGWVTARGDGWELTVGARARPRGVPAWAPTVCAQVWPDGVVRTFRMKALGRAWLGSVDVEHAPGSLLEGWLRPGRHRALVFSGRQVVGPPHPRPQN